METFTTSTFRLSSAARQVIEELARRGNRNRTQVVEDAVRVLGELTGGRLTAEQIASGVRYTYRSPAGTPGG